jgi:hypothetical protein
MPEERRQKFPWFIATKETSSFEAQLKKAFPLPDDTEFDKVLQQIEQLEKQIERLNRKNNPG